MKTTKKYRNEIAEYNDVYDGQTITVRKLKAKDKKVISNTRSNFSNCPNCLSKMTLDDGGLQKCSGDRLASWETQFDSFYNLSKDQQSEYLKNISFNSTFMELYDRWVYAKSNPDDPFTCGFTNQMFFPIPSCTVIIPDPAQVIRIEKKLGRKLTEEEILGEKELFEFQGSILEKYRNGARTVRIAMLRFPEDCY